MNVSTCFRRVKNNLDEIDSLRSNTFSTVLHDEVCVWCVLQHNKLSDKQQHHFQLRNDTNATTLNQITSRFAVICATRANHSAQVSHKW